MMASAARQPKYGFSGYRSAAAIMLVQLKEAHGRLLLEMERLELLGLGPPPEAEEVTTARWRSGQAALHRRTLSARIIDYLADRVGHEEAAALSALQSENRLAVSISAGHLQDWTLQAIRLDWRGYCKALRDLLMAMKANILLEKQVLYPMLEALEARRV